MMRPATKRLSPKTQAAIDDWLAKNGGARRFERGASNDFDSLGRYLERRGIEIKFSPKGEFTVREPGRNSRTVKLPGLFKIVDRFRIAEGLQPFVPGNTVR